MKAGLTNAALLCFLLGASIAQAHSDSSGQWPQQCGKSQETLSLCQARKLENANRDGVTGYILQFTMSPTETATETAEWWIPSGQRECTPNGSFFRLNGGQWNPAKVKCICDANDKKIIQNTAGKTVFVLDS